MAAEGRDGVRLIQHRSGICEPGARGERGAVNADGVASDVRSARSVEQRRDLRPVTEVEYEPGKEQHHEHYPGDHATDRNAFLRRHRVIRGKY